MCRARKPLPVKRDYVVAALEDGTVEDGDWGVEGEDYE